MQLATETLFRTLGDPTRRALFERLCREGEQTVHALTAFAGVSQPAVSKHLGVLRGAGLVADRKAGRETHYRAEPQGLAPFVDWIAFYGSFWRGRLQRLEALLQRIDPPEPRPAPEAPLSKPRKGRPPQKSKPGRKS